LPISGEQAVIFPFDDRITLAYLRFQLGAIEHDNVARWVWISPASAASSASVTPSRRTPASRDQFLRHYQLVRGQPVQVGQQPADSADPALWCRLHAAFCAVCVISAWYSAAVNATAGQSRSNSFSAGPPQPISVAGAQHLPCWACFRRSGTMQRRSRLPARDREFRRRPLAVT